MTPLDTQTDLSHDVDGPADAPARRGGMDQIRIRGGAPLKGRIPVSGAKNATLPLMIYQQLGAYLISEATVSALVLLLLCLSFFWLLERVVGGRADA